MTKERFEELLNQASSAGLDDTLIDDILSENAILWINSEVEDELSVEQENELVLAYRNGFLKGF